MFLNVLQSPMPKKPAKPAPKQAKPKPGPKPEVLQIDGNWQDAVRRSFQPRNPAGAWPKEGN
jgi:hypothetical protein